MEKQIEEILEYLEGKSEITVPMLQKDMHMSYDEARKMMSELENEDFVAFKGGIVYTVLPRNTANAQDDDDDEMESYIERRRAELLERLKQLELDNFNDENDDEDDKNSTSFNEDDFHLSDEDDNDDDAEDEDADEDEGNEDDEDQDDDNMDDYELAELFRIVAEDQDDEDDEDTVDVNMSVFLSHDLMPYKPKQVYYDIIREVYDEKQEVPICVMSKEEVMLFKEKLGDGFRFDEKKTEKAGWRKAYFTSQLYLPDGVLYAPILTTNENGDYFLQQKLLDPEDEGKMCVRQEFYMLLKRHDMIFGDFMLAKQFARVLDAVPVAMELYGALCEGKMLLDVT